MELRQYLFGPRPDAGRGEDEAHKAAIIADMAERRVATPEQIAGLRAWLSRVTPLSVDVERERTRRELCELLGYPAGIGDRDLYAGAVGRIRYLQGWEAQSAADKESEEHRG